MSAELPPVGREDPDIDRFIELAKHEEQILNSRINIFLVAESIMLVFAVEASARSEQLKTAAVAAGLALTFCWFLTSVRQEIDLFCCGKAMRARWPAFAIAYKGVPNWLKSFALVLLVYALPAIFLALWIGVYTLLPAPGAV